MGGGPSFRPTLLRLLARQHGDQLLSACSLIRPSPTVVGWTHHPDPTVEGHASTLDPWATLAATVRTTLVTVGGVGLDLQHHPGGRGHQPHRLGHGRGGPSFRPTLLRLLARQHGDQLLSACLLIRPSPTAVGWTHPPDPAHEGRGRTLDPWATLPATVLAPWVLGLPPRPVSRPPRASRVATVLSQMLTPMAMAVAVTVVSHLPATLGSINGTGGRPLNPTPPQPSPALPPSVLHQPRST
jgi:hypothetical protein